MSKRTFLVAAVLAAFSTALHAQEWVSFEEKAQRSKPSVTVLSSNDFETIIEINVKGMDVKEVTHKNTLYHELRFPDYFTTLEVGKPQLPKISEIIAIPDMANVKVSVIDTAAIIIKGYNVHPYLKTGL